jgi:hypothetical protein
MSHFPTFLRVTWRKLTSQHQPWAEKLYVLGGAGTSGFVSDVEVYDPLSIKRAIGIGGKLTHCQQFCVGSNAKLMERRAPMPTGRTGFSVAVLNGILGIWLRYK